MSQNTKNENLRGIGVFRCLATLCLQRSLTNYVSQEPESKRVRASSTRSSMPMAKIWKPALIHRLLSIVIVFCLSSIVHSQLSTAQSPLSTVHLPPSPSPSPSTAHRPLSTGNRPPSTVHRSAPHHLGLFDTAWSRRRHY